MVHGSVPQRGGNRQYRVDLTSGRAELLPTNGIFVHSRLAPDGDGILAGPYGLQWHDLKSREVTTLRPPENDSLLQSDDIARREANRVLAVSRTGRPGISNITVADRTGTR